MAGSSFGDIFKITSFGESHGKVIGVVIDACPAGLSLNEKDIQIFLDRRKSLSQFSTQRKEDDICEIVSGVFEGKTTGTPITVIVKNKDYISDDYEEIKEYYRPSHADYTYDAKYGFRDYRGGGRASGRETVARVIAGAVANKILSSLGINIFAFTQSIGHIHINRFDIEERFSNPFCMPDNQAAHLCANFINTLKEEGDSIGGMLTCIATGVPAGIGEPVFDKLDARLSLALMSIGSIKGIEFGAGFKHSIMKGSESNDSFYLDNGKIVKSSNNAGGILGGISDGSPIIMNLAIKGTPSIFKEQNTVNKNMEEIKINIKGRHDPVIVPRIIVVIESMVAISLLDLMLKNMSSRIEYIEKFYK